MRFLVLVLILSGVAVALVQYHIRVEYVMAAVGGFSGGVMLYYRLYYSDSE